VRTAVITASGVCSGVLVWGALSAVGIAALLAARGELTDEQLEQARLKLLSDRSPAVEELLPGARAA